MNIWRSAARSAYCTIELTDSGSGTLLELSSKVHPSRTPLLYGSLVEGPVGGGKGPELGPGLGGIGVAQGDKREQGNRVRTVVVIVAPTKGVFHSTQEEQTFDS